MLVQYIDQFVEALPSRDPVRGTSIVACNPLCDDYSSISFQGLHVSSPPRLSDRREDGFEMESLKHKAIPVSSIDHCDEVFGVDMRKSVLMQMMPPEDHVAEGQFQVTKFLSRGYGSPVSACHHRN